MESGTAGTGTETNGAANGAGTTAADDRIEVLNPATGQPIATIAVDSPEAVAETVARVRANQADWEA
ncbi:MAG TPA: hypothetical protein VHM66_00870, partial [Solirubrobacterales bacterium]|nr:hypothetical protein [Solirubrobacterales bacterium]